MRIPGKAVGLLLALAFPARSEAATIYVTNTTEKVSSTGGCSLPEAIYSANLRTNVAVDVVNPDGSDHFITTQCVPGTGNDTIILPDKTLFPMNHAILDAHNYTGLTATPVIISTITIEGNGSVLQWTETGHARAFAVADATVALPGGGSISGTGSLTIRNAYIQGFNATGGDGGASFGGGGMGAGGAIFVTAGQLIIEGSTFEGNIAIGGNAGGFNSSVDAQSGGGGGGGFSGNGGNGGGVGGSGGGGGARGNGGSGGAIILGGGGGGTLTNGSSFASGGAGGLACGGAGGTGTTGLGGDASCAGGGGGGGELGGKGSYGGGGGGGLITNFLGGAGGFGGGGGGGGGFGGFGGGGGGGQGGCNNNAGLFGGIGDPDGGGGAGLGGAVFNDGGSVVIRDSTFVGNVAMGGFGQNAGCDKVLNRVGVNLGAGAGGAIFSLNGSLTVNDSTISGNSSTSGGGGIEVFATVTATFILDNTIIFNNGANECLADPGSPGIVIPFGSHNLVGNPLPLFCPGVVTSADPQLGPLRNNGGFTATMAIPKTSAAFNAADPTTSLPTDQRGQMRPAEGMGGIPDIGAFELCLEGNGFLQIPCPIIAASIFPSQTTLTVQVSPAAGGTTAPAPGAYSVGLGSVQTLAATPNPGFAFVNWTGAVTDPNNPSTTIVMNGPETVTANFAQVTCVNNLSGRGTAGLFGKPERIDLTWTAFGNATSYNVLRGMSPGGENPVPIGATTTTAYTDTSGLVSGTTYYYVVQPVSGATAVCTSNQTAVKAP